MAVVLVTLCWTVKLGFHCCGGLVVCQRRVGREIVGMQVVTRLKVMLAVEHQLLMLVMSMMLQQLGCGSDAVWTAVVRHVVRLTMLVSRTHSSSVSTRVRRRVAVIVGPQHDGAGSSPANGQVTGEVWDHRGRRRWLVLGLRPLSFSWFRPTVFCNRCSCSGHRRTRRFSIPAHRITTCQHPVHDTLHYLPNSAFRPTSSCSSSSVWNSLPDSLRNPVIGENSFRQSLKTFLFATYWCIQRIRGFTTMRYINRLFTYLLAYLFLWEKLQSVTSLTW